MIKKYDRFKWGDEIIEFTGLKTWGTDYIFKVICPRPGVKKGSIAIYSHDVFQASGFEKIPRSAYSHPLLSEIGAELKDNPAFLEDLIKFCVLLTEQAEPKDTEHVFKLVRKHVPVEFLMTLETMEDMEAWRG